MQITGQQVIPAARERVWAALTDPEVLKRCLPGCQSVEQQPDYQYAVLMTTTVGPMRVRMRGQLKLENVVEGESCSMRFEGQGGAMGFASGQAQVDLVETNGETQLRYAAEALMGGKLAQLGGRVIDGVVQKLSGDFFDALRAEFQDVPTAQEPDAKQDRSKTPQITPELSALQHAQKSADNSIQVDRAAPSPAWAAAAWWQRPIPGWVAVLIAVAFGFILGRI